MEDTQTQDRQPESVEATAQGAKRGRGRPRGRGKQKEAKPKGKPGRPRGSRQFNPMPDFFNAVLSFLLSRAFRSLCYLANIPDHRKDPAQCTFPIFQIRICELLWMLSGGKSGLFYDDFLLEPQTAEAVGEFCRRFNQPYAQNPDGTVRMPTVDTLKDDMETMPPEELEMVWHVLVQELDAINLFRGTRYENMPIFAIDGVDGFRTAYEVPKLLHRKTTGKGDEKHVEYYAKFALASLCHPIGGAGFPVAGMMVKNKEDGGTVDGQATKQQCEYNALEEMLIRVTSLFPGLRCLVSLDGLYLDGNNIRLFEKLGQYYGMTFKDDDLAKLHVTVEKELKKRGGHYTTEYRYDNTCEKYEVWYCNDIKHNFSGVDTPEMNYLYLIVTIFENDVETKTLKFGWMTNLRLDAANSLHVALILRRHWGVETMNNDLKHLGMNLTHKFDSRGNGPENFATMGFIAALLQSVMRDSNFMEKLENQPVTVPVCGKAAKAKDIEKEQESQIQITVLEAPEKEENKRIEEATESLRLFLDRRRRVKADIARIRIKRRWHTREGWCDYLCRSMQQTSPVFEQFKVPAFTMLWNLTNQRK